MGSIEEKGVGAGVQTAGQMLCYARKLKGLSHRDVASTLGLMVSHVRAIEANRYDAAFEGNYFQSCLEAYAELVGLDKIKIRDLYLSQTPPVVEPDLLHQELHGEPKTFCKAIFPVAAVAGCLALSLWVVYRGLDSQPGSVVDPNNEAVVKLESESQAGKLVEPLAHRDNEEKLIVSTPLIDTPEQKPAIADAPDYIAKEFTQNKTHNLPGSEIAPANDQSTYTPLMVIRGAGNVPSFVRPLILLPTEKYEPSIRHIDSPLDSSLIHRATTPQLLPAILSIPSNRQVDKNASMLAVVSSATPLSQPEVKKLATSGAVTSDQTGQSAGEGGNTQLKKQRSIPTKMDEVEAANDAGHGDTIAHSQWAGKDSYTYKMFELAIDFIQFTKAVKLYVAEAFNDLKEVLQTKYEYTVTQPSELPGSTRKSDRGRVEKNRSPRVVRAGPASSATKEIFVEDDVSWTVDEQRATPEQTQSTVDVWQMSDAEVINSYLDSPE
ncbi:MAG: helix-turn-helix domain-containing protein [Pseudomonadales bacterium]